MSKFLTACLLSLALVPLIVLQSGTSVADQTDARLDQLFATLQLTEDIRVLEQTENSIWQIWQEHANEDVENLMAIGSARMSQQSYAEAMLIFSRIIDSFPDYAEAWNQRATLYYILGDYSASIKDIEKTLQLESRHFGALSGLGLVYLQQNELRNAKQAFEALLRVHPHSPSAIQNMKIVEEQLRFSII